MDTKVGEYLSIRYKIEKTLLKQQSLEGKLNAVSGKIKKERKQYWYFLSGILVFFSAIVFLCLYHWGGIIKKNETKHTSVVDVVSIHKIKNELIAVKSDVNSYKDELKEEEKLRKTLIKASEKKEYRRRYCILNKVYKNNGIIFIEADFVDFFKGEKAVQKAKEQGKAMQAITSKGDTLYSLPEKYFVSNVNPKIRVLKVNDNVRLKNIKNSSEANYSLALFQKIIKDKSLLVLEMSDGVVYGIFKKDLSV